MKPLKVLWVTSEYNPRVGGLERYVEECIDAISSLCQTGLITGPEQFPLPHQSCVHVGALNLVRPGTYEEYEANGNALAALVQDFGADVVHFASAGLACYAPAVSGNVPVFTTVHCKDLTRFWQVIPGVDVKEAIAAGLRACETVFCVSAYTKSHVDALVPGANAVVLPPGLNLRLNEHSAIQKSNHPQPFSDPIILTVARLIERKGHLPLLRALEKVNLPFQWHVVGTGALKESLAAEVAKSPIWDRVHLHGLLSDAELIELYAQCSLFALTPIVLEDAKGIDAEGFGLVYLEAATYQKACIASNVSGSAEAVIDGETGLLVDPYDASDMAQAIEQLLLSPARCRDMGTAAFERVIQDFSWADRACSMVKAYERALNRGESA